MKLLLWVVVEWRLDQTTADQYGQVTACHSAYREPVLDVVWPDLTVC